MSEEAGGPSEPVQKQCKTVDSSTTIDSNSLCPEMAGKWKSLDTQVGGHQFAHGNYENQKLGMVDLGNGFVLKSLQNPPRGTRELGFYEKVFDSNSSDPDLLELREFVPPFYGSEIKDGCHFLKLANLTNGFKHPSVIDLKMGRVTYDQEATQEKIAHEVSKYPPIKNLGFQITGFMVYDPETQSNERFDKSYCRNLTEANITTDGLGRFFRLHKNDLRRDAIQPLVSKLKRLELWFLKQKKFSFIASSLLIVYEGSKLARNSVEGSGIVIGSNLPQRENNNIEKYSSHRRSDKEQSEKVCKSDTNTKCSGENQNAGGSYPTSTSGSENKKCNAQKRLSDCDISLEDGAVKKAKSSNAENGKSNSALESAVKNTENSTLSKVVDVHLIDFAHAFPAKDTDHNFLFGLQKLIASLQSLLK